MSTLSEAIKPVRAVERTLDLLDLFLQQPEGLGLPDAARMTGLPKSTAYRLLLTLESHRYLERNEGAEEFQISRRFRDLILRWRPVDLRVLAQPVIEELRDTCYETVGLHLLVGNERLCIASSVGKRKARTSGRVGSRAPLYSGASSRAMLAFLPEARWEEVIQTTGLAPITPRTITDPEKLRAELRRIRSEGYAVSTGEWDEAVTSVAAPLFREQDLLVGSINLSGPTIRFGPNRVRLLVGALKAAAAVISQRLADRKSVV